MARHKWEKTARDGEEKCSMCDRERVLVTNNRRTAGAPVGKHWEYWRSGGLFRTAGSCAPKKVGGLNAL